MVEGKRGIDVGLVLKIQPVDNGCFLIGGVLIEVGADLFKRTVGIGFGRVGCFRIARAFGGPGGRLFAGIEGGVVQQVVVSDAGGEEDFISVGTELWIAGAVFVGGELFGFAALKGE